MLKVNGIVPGCIVDCKTDTEHFQAKVVMKTKSSGKGRATLVVNRDKKLLTISEGLCTLAAIQLGNCTYDTRGNVIEEG